VLAIDSGRRGLLEEVNRDQNVPDIEGWLWFFVSSLILIFLWVQHKKGGMALVLGHEVDALTT
jgi:hypothetical protein